MPWQALQRDVSPGAKAYSSQELGLGFPTHAWEMTPASPAQATPMINSVACCPPARGAVEEEGAAITPQHSPARGSQHPREGNRQGHDDAAWLPPTSRHTGRGGEGSLRHLARGREAIALCLGRQEKPGDTHCSRALSRRMAAPGCASQGGSTSGSAWPSPRMWCGEPASASSMGPTTRGGHC